MSNPIAADSRNLVVNILEPQHAALGKAAFSRGISLGALVRCLLQKGAEIEDPELAAKLREARAKRFAVNAAVLVVGFTAVFQATLAQSDKSRLRPRFVRQSAVRCIQRHEPIAA